MLSLCPDLPVILVLFIRFGILAGIASAKIDLSGRGDAQRPRQWCFGRRVVRLDAGCWQLALSVSALKFEVIVN